MGVVSTKQAVMTVAQWHRNQFIRVPKMDACLCDKRNILVLFWLGFRVQILFILILFTIILCFWLWVYISMNEKRYNRVIGCHFNFLI